MCVTVQVIHKIPHGFTLCTHTYKHLILIFQSIHIITYRGSWNHATKALKILKFIMHRTEPNRNLKPGVNIS
ncbi:hypothetical protein TorRG33x02_120190 [Trema orientale]|uniref:Uncharacterized protein n=1 Tax=Trema orientale TaxID=63057 RepID=A0A2P5F331_TREOI|nr:hypothetical protein TorRG33x02_120190 [Trema orientale]